jgi:hypothetical protein
VTTITRGWRRRGRRSKASVDVVEGEPEIRHQPNDLHAVGHVWPSDARRAWNSGCSLKQAAAEELVEAINAVTPGLT